MELPIDQKENSGVKNLIYRAIKVIVKGGLRCYYKKIKIVGLENVPLDKPVLFLPNHQNALMDVLLMVTDCNRKPYFLTRSDVFGKPFLNAVFNFFRMIPVYRLRDGRDTLPKNDAVFDKCADILGRGEAMAIFPEANHNLKRRVRPLSKGFTRILFRTMKKYPDLDVQLVPVGFNYKDAVSFPDTVSIYYGKSIALKSIYKETDLPSTVDLLKNLVTVSLQQLTTHIPTDENYEEIEAKLISEKVDFLNPVATNNNIEAILEKPFSKNGRAKTVEKKKSILYWLFTLLNFPVVFVWRFMIKPKVGEPEFIGTMRFATAFIGLALYFLVLFVVLLLFINITAALITVLTTFAFNWIVVKLEVV